MSPSTRVFVASLVVLATGAACTSRTDAEAALASAQQAITAQHADAIRYAPDAFQEVMTLYAAAQQRFDAGEYRDAIQQANDAAARARALPAAIEAGRDSLRPRWTDLHGTLSFMIAALEERLAAMDRAGRRPAGVTARQAAGARADLDTLRLGFSNAAAAWDRGDLTDALHAGDRLRVRGLEALQTLGVDMGPHGAR